MTGLRGWLTAEISSGAVIADAAILAGLAALGWLVSILVQS